MIIISITFITSRQTPLEIFKIHVLYHNKKVGLLTHPVIISF